MCTACQYMDLRKSVDPMSIKNLTPYSSNPRQILTELCRFLKSPFTPCCRKSTEQSFSKSCLVHRNNKQSHV